MTAINREAEVKVFTDRTDTDIVLRIGDTVITNHDHLHIGSCSPFLFYVFSQPAEIIMNRMRQTIDALQ